MFEMHKKSSRLHGENKSFPELTFCGGRRWGRIRVTDDWSKVNCGNCIVQYKTASTPTGPEKDGPINVRVLMMDSIADPTGRYTVWEVDGANAWALGHSGKRLHVLPALLANVEADFGPLRGVSEVELVRRHLLSLEDYVLNN